MCSLVGIGIIFLMTQQATGISDIESSLLEQPVKVEGIVSDVKEYSNLSALKVYDSTGSIKVVAFEGEYFVGQEVSLRGVVQEYKGELQVVVN